MTQPIKVAAVQMDATPAPLHERLARAETLVANCAQEGAQLVVLPELFNLGYGYEETNYAAAEPQTGKTFAWMQHQAKAHNVHLVGTFLLLDGDHVYNTAFLIAPDGTFWRYDKQFPFALERAFFREGDRITIADTALGKIGMMICWDAAHASVWRRYAGQVQLMAIPSCAPNMQHFNLELNAETSIPIHVDNNHFSDVDVRDQAAWLGVPVVMSGGSGELRSRLPIPMSLGALLAARPGLLQHVAQGSEARIVTDYGNYTQVISAEGAILGTASSGDSFTIAQVSPADSPPAPSLPQPPMRTAWLSYAVTDIAAHAATIPLYQRKLRQHFGANMAPTSDKTLLWGALVASAVVVGWLIGKRNRKYLPED